MHHFGAQGPEVLAKYQQAFLSWNKVKTMQDKLNINQVQKGEIPEDVYQMTE